MSKLDRSKCLTVEWKIVNFSHFKDEELLFNLKGNVFKTETKSCSTWWSTSLAQSITETYCPNNLQYNITFGLCDITGRSSEFQCEVFLLTTYGESQIPYKHNDLLYKSGIFYFSIKKDNIFRNPSLLLPQDTLTVYYRFWDKEIINTKRLLFRTVLHQVNFLWQTKTFLFTEDYLQKTLHEQDILQMIMFLKCKREPGTHEVRLETQPNKQGFPTIVIAELSIQDDHGQCISRKTDHNCSTKIWDIEIYKKTNKISSLQFRLKSVVAFSMECPTLSTQDPPPDSGSTTAAEANSQLVREKPDNDATLKAGGKSFPVHQNILSAKSLVFRKMFERYHPSLDVSDVDSDTLERLLVYLYSDTLECVQYKQALALYRAASTYAVPSLKNRCADMLKEGLAVKNACDILVLADQHADEDLMRCTVDFIRDHREVVSSEEWDKLEASNLHLALKTTRELCLTKEGK